MNSAVLLATLMCVGLAHFCCGVPVKDSPTVKITGNNDGKHVVSGTPVEITCKGQGSPNPALTFAPEYPNSTQQLSDDGLVLTIRPKEDFCVTCTGKNEHGTDSKRLCIDVVTKPDVIITGAEKPVDPGTKVVLICSAKSGDPSPSVGFVSALPPKAIMEDVQDGGKRLTVKEATTGFCATCVGSNAAGQDSATTCVIVTQPEIPPVVKVTGSNNYQPVLKGTSVKVMCSAPAGSPKPALSFSNTYPTGGHVQDFGDSLVLTVSATEHFCVKCTGKNSYGSDSKELCVDIIVPPKVKIYGSNLGEPINQGDEVELVCQAAEIPGNPEPTLTWGPSGPPMGAVNKDPTSHSISFTLANVQSELCVDCIGRNPAGIQVDRECVAVIAKEEGR